MVVSAQSLSDPVHMKSCVDLVMIVLICTMVLLTKNIDSARYQDTHHDWEEQLERSVDKESWRNRVRQYLLHRRGSLQVRFCHMVNFCKQAIAAS